MAFDKTESINTIFPATKQKRSLRQKAKKKKSQKLFTPLSTPSCAGNTRLELFNVQSSRGVRLSARAANMLNATMKNRKKEMSMSAKNKNGLSKTVTFMRPM